MAAALTPEPPTGTIVASDWRGAILVCGKCSKRVGGGFGDKGRTPLAKALRKAMALGKGRKAALGVVETKCLGICPRRAVMVIDTRMPHRWRAIPAGAPIAPLVEDFARGT